MTPNMIITDIPLRSGAHLIRTTDQFGNKISLIELNGVEVWACYSMNEKDMVERWNREYIPKGDDQK